MGQSEIEVNICNRRKARENAYDQVTIGFGFHWLRKWREFCQPIAEHSGVKPKQIESVITFNTQLKTSLIRVCFGFALLAR